MIARAVDAAAGNCREDDHGDDGEADVARVGADVVLQLDLERVGGDEGDVDDVRRPVDLERLDEGILPEEALCPGVGRRAVIVVVVVVVVEGSHRKKEKHFNILLKNILQIFYFQNCRQTLTGDGCFV